MVFVEWGDAIDALLPLDHVQVELTLPDEGDQRWLALTWHGRSWAARIERLAATLEPWKA